MYVRTYWYVMLENVTEQSQPDFFLMKLRLNLFPQKGELFLFFFNFLFDVRTVRTVRNVKERHRTVTT